MFSENQRFLDNGVPTSQYSVLGQGRQMIGLQDRAVESQGSIFDTFEARLRVPSIHLFHQVSVYRCARG